MVLEQLAIVMPVAYAGVRLPGHGSQLIARATLDVLNDCCTALGRQHFRVEDGFEAAIVPTTAGVVVISRNVQSDLAERQIKVVEVDEVGAMLIDQILAA